MKQFFEKRYGKAQLDAWKQKYGSIFGYKTEDGKSCVLRCPDLDIIDACRTTSGGSSIRFDKALVEYLSRRRSGGR